MSRPLPPGFVKPSILPTPKIPPMKQAPKLSPGPVVAASIVVAPPVSEHEAPATKMPPAKRQKRAPAAKPKAVEKEKSKKHDKKSKKHKKSKHDGSKKDKKSKKHHKSSKDKAVPQVVQATLTVQPEQQQPEEAKPDEIPTGFQSSDQFYLFSRRRNKQISKFSGRQDSGACCFVINTPFYPRVRGFGVNEITAEGDIIEIRNNLHPTKRYAGIDLSKICLYSDANNPSWIFSHLCPDGFYVSRQIPTIFNIDTENVPSVKEEKILGNKKVPGSSKHLESGIDGDEEVHSESSEFNSDSDSEAEYSDESSDCSDDYSDLESAMQRDDDEEDFVPRSSKKKSSQKQSPVDETQIELPEVDPVAFVQRLEDPKQVVGVAGQDWRGVLSFQAEYQPTGQLKAFRLLSIKCFPVCLDDLELKRMLRAERKRLQALEEMEDIQRMIEKNPKILPSAKASTA